MRKPDARQLQRQEPCAWDESQIPFRLDTNQENVVVRPRAAYAAANHEAPLAPKQGIGGASANPRGQRQSPIAGTYGLRTPRGKITLVACEGCRRRKSKCDGARPKCDTCQSKNLTCVYDVAGNARTTVQLRARVRQLAKELDDMKSVVSLLAAAPDRASAVNWASELEKNGFAHHSAEEVKKALSASSRPAPALPYNDAFEILNSSEPFSGRAHALRGPSYGSPSREDRERSQSSLACSHDNAVDVAVTANPSALSLEDAADLNRFGIEHAPYRRAKKDLLANGWSEVQIVGSSETDVDALLLDFLDPQDTRPNLCEEINEACSRGCL